MVQPGYNDCGCSPSLSDQQDQIAHDVYTMTVFRDHCFLLPYDGHTAITNVQQVVEEDVELTRIQ
jgi:hypothetical protein